MKVLFSCIICLSFSIVKPAVADGQSSWEIGIFGGISNYMGDLAPDPVFKESHPAVGGIIKRNVSNYFSYSLSLNYGKISGNDSNYKSLAPRGLKFESHIVEISGQMEFNFLKFGNGDLFKTRRFSPYLFTGLSLFHFDPTVSYQGNTYDLRALNTEGQGFAPNAPKEYKLWQLAIPIGGGVKINLSENFNLLALAGYRATFTSYLDDVGGVYVDKQILINNKGDLSAHFSDPTGIAERGGFNGNGLQRGNPDKNDWYMFYGLTLSYILPGPICPTFHLK
jgi:hypothetical protein